MSLFSICWELSFGSTPGPNGQPFKFYIPWSFDGVLTGTVDGSEIPFPTTVWMVLNSRVK